MGEQMTARAAHPARRLRWAALALLVGGGLALGRIASRPAPSPILATVPIHVDPRAEIDVALASRQGRLLIVNAGLAQGFDTRTGARVYVTAVGSASTQGMGGPPPVVDEVSRRVYVPDLAAAAVYALDARTGRVLRVLGVGHRPDLVAVDGRAGRLLVASTADWTLTTLDARTGAPLRSDTLAVGDTPGQLVADPRSGHAFVADYGGGVATVAARTGRLLRRVVPVGSHIVTDLMVDARARRVLGLVEARPDVVVLDARTGAVVRTVAVGDSPDALVIDAGTGRAFIADAGAGAVQVRGTRRGGYVGSVPVGPAPLVALDARRHRVVAATNTGFVVLDARNGRVLRRLSLAIDADALVVDERTGHVLVVSVGGVERAPDPWAWLLRPLRRWLPVLPAPTPRLRAIPSLLRVLDERHL